MKWLVAIGALFCLVMSGGKAFVTVRPIVGLSSSRTAATRSKTIADGRQRAEAKTVLKMAEVVVEFTNSKKTVTAVVGTPLSQMCAKAGVKVKYNCKQGDCATCVINIDGRNVKACQGRVPASRRIVKIKA